MININNMGWYQSCIAQLDFCKTTYKDEFDIQNDIDKNESLIKSYSSQISHYIGIPIRELREEDETLEDTLNRVHAVIDDCVKEIVELSSCNERLNILMENWDLRDGDYVYNPNYKKNIRRFIKENITPSIKNQEEKKEERRKSSGGK